MINKKLIDTTKPFAEQDMNDVMQFLKISLRHFLDVDYVDVTMEKSYGQLYINVAVNLNCIERGMVIVKTIRQLRSIKKDTPALQEIELILGKILLKLNKAFMPIAELVVSLEDRV